LLLDERIVFVMGILLREIVELMFYPVKKEIKLDSESTKQPTACVTCAGAGTAKPSSQKNEKA
jgi:hypothetical protein